MSSTNRKGRQGNVDYYVTPVSEIELFLTELLKWEPNVLNGDILDPCAGGCGKAPMSYPMALKKMGVKDSQITTVDIRTDSLAHVKKDYLRYKVKSPPFLIITNPPFCMAREIAEKAMEDVVDEGFVALLLRLNFFGSQGRRAFWARYTPKYAFVHPVRMSFTDDGQTDSIEYMHCVWQKGKHPDNIKLVIL